MTEIRLYQNVPHLGRFLVQMLTKKMLPEKRRVVVVVDNEKESQLDERLWTYSNDSFLPHCLASHKLAERTPVVIASRAEAGQVPIRDVMVSLGPDCPEAAASYGDLVVMVEKGIDSYDGLAARLDDFKSRGFGCKVFDLKRRRGS